MCIWNWCGRRPGASEPGPSGLRCGGSAVGCGEVVVEGGLAQGEEREVAMLETGETRPRLEAAAPGISGEEGRESETLISSSSSSSSSLMVGTSLTTTVSLTRLLRMSSMEKSDLRGTGAAVVLRSGLEVMLKMWCSFGDMGLRGTRKVFLFLGSLDKRSVRDEGSMANDFRRRREK